jgi:predicted transcriptional regulator
MKRDVVTVRLDPDMKPTLDRICRRSGRTRSEVIREALRRRLALERFRELRRRVSVYAEKSGYLTDEDVFDRVS